MKNLIILSALALIGFSSCKKDNSTPETRPVYKPQIPPDKLPADSSLQPIFKS